MQGELTHPFPADNIGDYDVPSLLRLEAHDDKLTGHPPAHAANNNDAVWGGVLMGQAVAAASRGIDRPLHMMSARFSRAARVAMPIAYAVTNAHDGGSFSTRHVDATQDGRKLVEFSLSYHAQEPGLAFETGWCMPAAPESLPSLGDATQNLEHLPRSTRRSLGRTRGLEIRPVDTDAIVTPQTGRPIRFWIRVRDSLHDTPNLWAPAIAYLSDFLMAGGGVTRHTFLHDPAFFGVTLNHSLWLHLLADPSHWLLHEVQSHWTGHGRTLNIGRIHTRDGRLVATTVQEALLRRRAPRTKDTAR